MTSQLEFPADAEPKATVHMTMQPTFKETPVRNSRGVFNTDRVNLDGLLCPASSLMHAEEHHQREAMSRGHPLGMPSNIAHDMHRIVGFTRPLGLYADGSMVRVLGEVHEAQTDDEKKVLQARAETYWAAYHREGTEEHRASLTAKLAGTDLSAVTFIRLEAAIAKREGLAAELYPELFTPGGDLVDKDGLVDYRALLARMACVQPGVFHDPAKDLLLFAHRFFRRSLSHRNKLNEYFLQSFHATAVAHPGLRVRLRLDPDLLGEPSSAQHLLELEYWRGPHYSDDIAAIPNAVTEHKAGPRLRHFEGVDLTQIWWKAPETRQTDAGAPVVYKTAEIEELVENPSWGLGDDQFGCRYAHAEFSDEATAITHFDGAIRSYPADDYFVRLDTAIDRAGKHAAYTKLFRFDNALAIGVWKRLLSDFFRGNTLIPEYLGAPKEREEVKPAEPSEAENAGATEISVVPQLAALIQLEPGRFEGEVDLIVELTQLIGAIEVPFVEIGGGEVARYLKDRFNVSHITSVDFGDGFLNLPRISFAESAVGAEFKSEVAALARALEADVKAGLVNQAAVPFAWGREGLILTLSIAGYAEKVVELLGDLGELVDPVEPAEMWIDSLAERIHTIAPSPGSGVLWSDVSRGVLAIPRNGELTFRLEMPDSVRQALREVGVLSPVGDQSVDSPWKKHGQSASQLQQLRLGFGSLQRSSD